MAVDASTDSLPLRRRQRPSILSLIGLSLVGLVVVWRLRCLVCRFW